MSEVLQAWFDALTDFPATRWQIAATATLGTMISINLLGKVFRSTVLVPKFTIMHDLPKLGTRRKDGKRKETVVICGGSVAGLFTAAVCSQHFERVVIIEAEGTPEDLGKDVPSETDIRLTDTGRPVPVLRRKRVFQYHAPHLYMSPIILSLQRLFPSWKKELDHYGVSQIGIVFNHSYSSVPCRQVWDHADPEAPQTVAISREAFETLVRRLLVRDCSNVAFVHGTVEGYQADEETGKLSGVRYCKSTDGGDVNLVQPGDFVVDATGPAAHSYLKWLKASGFHNLPNREVYDPHQAYFSSVWTIPNELQSQAEKIIPRGLGTAHQYGNNPDWSTGNSKLALCSIYERKQILISLGGWGVKPTDAPHTVPEMRDFLNSLDKPHLIPQWLFDLFDFFEAHEDEIPHYFTDAPTGKMSFIKYHEAKAGELPSNWVAVGDTIMKANPVYGEGCKKAMVDAVSLDNVLRTVPSKSDLPHNLPARYFSKAIGRSAGSWDSNKAGDYGFPTTIPVEGETLEWGAFSRNLARYLFYTGTKSRYVMKTTYLAFFGLAPATDVLSPSVLVRVLWTWLTRA